MHPPSLKDQTLRDEYDDYFTKKDSLLFGADSQCGTWPTGTHGCGRVPRSCPLRGPARTGPGAFAPGDSNRARLVWLLGCLSPGMRHWKRHGADEELLAQLFSKSPAPYHLRLFKQVAGSRLPKEGIAASLASLSLVTPIHILLYRSGARVPVMVNAGTACCVPLASGLPLTRLAANLCDDISASGCLFGLLVGLLS